MADGYDLISPVQVPSAEELARRNLARAAREEEIARRKRELHKKGFGARFPADAMSRRGPGASEAQAEADKKAQEELDSRVRSRQTLDEIVASSSLSRRALARARTEELIAGGASPEDAAAQANAEQEGRRKAFEQGQELVRSGGGNADKEALTFAASSVSSVGAPVARMLGFGQAASEAEAHAAGAQAEMSRIRQETYAHPDIAGGVAGAAQNLAQMGPGAAAAMLGHPGVGMAIMSGQFGAQEYSRAIYEGQEAGLAGGELQRYGAIQGGIESAVMPIFSAIPGLKGIEGRVLKQNIARAVANNPKVRNSLVSGAANLTKDTAAEIAEEVVTEYFHGVTTQKRLDQDVDYEAVMKDTVLQTLLMMGMNEGVSQAGRLVTAGEQLRPESQSPVPPEIETLLSDPSRKNYEAAVKAGAPPADPNSIKSRNGREQYARDLRKRMEQQAAAAQQPMPQEAPTGTLPVSPVDVLTDLFLKEGDQREEVSSQGQQVQQVQQGRQEGLLSPEAVAPAVAQDESQPAPQTREEFEKTYVEELKKLLNTPDELGSKQQAARMADLYDAHPDWADSIEEKLGRKAPPEPVSEELRKELKKPKALEAAAKEFGIPLSGDTDTDLRAIAESRRVFDTIPEVIREVTGGVKPEDVFDEGDKYVEEVAARLPKTKFPIPPQRISEAIEAVLLPSESQTVPDLSPGAPSPDQPSPSTAGPVSTLKLPEGGIIEKGDDGLFYPSLERPGKLPNSSLTGFKTEQQAAEWFTQKPQATEPPKVESPSKSIGLNPEGHPIYESKTGLRSVGGEMEQAASMKKTKDGMKAVLAGPREDRFKTEEERKAEQGPRQGEVGMMLSAGERVKTSSGRLTTPFPKISTTTDRKASATMKRANVWLHANALAEAESRGDDYNATMFRGEKNPANMPQASKDAMEEYLFGEQPKVVPSILKTPKLPSRDVIESPDLQLENKRNADAAKRKQAIKAGGFVVGGRVTQTSTGRTGVLEGISDKSGTVSVRFDKDGSVLSGTDVTGFVRAETAKPEKTLRGQTLLPGMEGRAAEIDRQDFIDRHQTRLLEQVPEVATEQDTAEAMRTPTRKILGSIWRGEFTEPQDIFDSELWTELEAAIADKEPRYMHAQLEDMADASFRRALKHSEELRKKTTATEPPSAPAPEDPRAALREQLRAEMAKKQAEKEQAPAKAKESKRPAQTLAQKMRDKVIEQADPLLANNPGEMAEREVFRTVTHRVFGQSLTEAVNDETLGDVAEWFNSTKPEEFAERVHRSWQRMKEAGISTPKAPKTPRPKSEAKQAAEDKTAAARARKEAAKQAILNKLKNMGSKPPGPTARSSILPIDPEMVTLVADYAMASMDLGISKFREFMIDFRETFGPEVARRLAMAAEEAWGLLPDFGYKVDPAGDATAILEGMDNDSDNSSNEGMGGMPGESGGGVAPEAGGDASLGDAETGTGSDGGSVSGGTDETGGTDAGDTGTESEGTGPEQGSGTKSNSGKSSRKGGRKKTERVPREVAGTGNLRIQPGDTIAPRGAITKLKANLAAIKLLKSLQNEGRQATEDEQKILMQYTGWGSLQHVFDEVRGNEYMVRPGLPDRYGEYYRKSQVYQKPNEYEPIEVVRERVESWEQKWGEAYKYLKENLTKDEWNKAAASTLNAHFTSREVITNGIWGALERMGVNGGRFLEPSAGIGSLIGLMPDEIAKSSDVVAIELDSLTGEMVKHLYPEADVHVKGFEDVPIPPGSIDVAATNVPFHKIGPEDAKERYGRDMNLHNYFIARILDSLRPGGVAAVISTHFTMDANSEDRALLAGKADLVGAIRLPNTAFKANAGTEVTTDIMFFRKPDGTPFKGEAWANLAAVGDATVAVRKGKKGKLKNEQVAIAVNEYFANHPEMVLGTHSLEGKQYAAQDSGQEYTLQPIEGADLSEQLRKAIENLPADITNSDHAADMPELEIGTKGVDGRIEFRGGKLQEWSKGEWKAPEWISDAVLLTKKGEPRKLKESTKAQKVADAMRQAIAYTRVRNAYEQHLNNMRDETVSDEEYKKSQKLLNDQYDAYRAAHGPLNAKESDFLDRDPGFFFTSGLEIETERKVEGSPETKQYTKADVFRERTVSPVIVPSKADSIEEAVKISLAWRGSLNLPWMASLTGMDEGDIRKELLDSGVVFQDPETGFLEPADTYLAGNVHAKLRAAKQAVKDGAQEYAKNVASLMEIQPEKKTIDVIQPALGDTWIPADLVHKWAAEEVGLPKHTIVTYNEKSDIWHVSVDRWSVDQDVQNTWGTDSTDVADLMSLVLNGQSTRVMDRVPDGVDANGKQKFKQVVNEVQTQANSVKAERMRTKFEAWAKSNDTAAPLIEQAFNEQKNFYVKPRYNGEHMTFPGMSELWLKQMRPYQKNTIWRAIREGRGMIAHGVGAGKTAEIIAIAMELKRLGKATKPLIVVQNSTLGQFARTFTEVYPAAKVLVATKRDLEPGNRAKFMARIATGNWDSIVMAKSTFNAKLPNDPVREEAMVEGLIEELKAIMVEQELESGKGAPSVKAIQQQINALKKRLVKITKRINASTDTDVYFEQMGVDAVFLDEAHDYKKPPFVTKLDRKIKGISNEVSARALSALVKLRFVQDNNNGRNTFMATGTPITNTLGEAWLLMNMIAPDVNREFGVSTFDRFVGLFARINETLEQNAVGKLVRNTRLAKFRNGHALGHYIQAGWDVLLGEPLHEAIREFGGGNLPRLKDGKDTLHLVERSKAFDKFAAFFLDVYDAYKALEGEAKKIYSWIPVVIYGAAQAAAIDVRLVDPTAEDDPGSKINKMVEGVFDAWQEGTDKKLTQLIFSDLSGRRSIDSLRAFADGVGVTLEIEDDTELEEEDDGEEGGEDEDKPVVKEEKEEDRWLYQEIKRKLVAKGIPEDQVQIINDHNKTTESMLAFQDTVRSGDVRIVIGHSDTLGTGVNVQPLLKNIWELDIPMVPAKREQRKGRIIRSGNTNEEVGVNVMAMQKSLDGTLMAMNLRKATFAEQALMGKLGGEFDDPFSESIMSMADMQAAMNDDPLFYRQKELEHALRALRLDREGLDQQKSRERSRLETNVWTINNTKETIAFREKALNALEQALSANPEMTVEGTKAKTIKDADSKLKAAYDKSAEEISRKTQEQRIAPLNGFSAHVPAENYAAEAEYGGLVFRLIYGERPEARDDESGNKVTDWVSSSGTSIELGGKSLETTRATTYSTLVKTVEAIPEDLKRKIADNKEFIARKEEENEKLKVFLDSPFEGQAELESLERELERVTQEMYERDNPVEVQVEVTQEHMPEGYELVAPGTESETIKSLGLPQKTSDKWHIVAPGGFSVGEGSSSWQAYQKARADNPSRFPKLVPPAKEAATESAPEDTMSPMTPSRRAALKAREELRELQKTGTKYLKTIRDEWDRIVQGGVPTTGGIPLTKEMASALAGYTGNAIARGVKRIEIVVRDMRATLDESTLNGLKPAIIRVWNRYREQQPELALEEATPESFDAAMEAETTAVIDEAIRTAAPESTYSTKNAFSAAARESLGMEPRRQPERQDRETSVDQARLIGETKQGAERIDTLIRELTANPRAVTPLENDLLNYRNAELGVKLEASLRKQIQARSDGDAAAESIAATDAELLRDAKEQLIELVLEPIGTAAGRALQARKAIINQDFTIVRMALEYQAAFGEAPSTEQLAKMQEKIDALNASIADLQNHLEAQDSKNNELESKLKEAHEALAEAAAQGPVAPEKRKPTFMERLAQEGREQASRGFAKLKAMKGKAYSIEGAAADLADALFDVAAGYIKQGVVKLADFLSRVEQELGDDAKKLTQQLTDAFNQALASTVETEQDAILSNLDPEDDDSVGRVARDLHRYVIQRDGLDASPEGRNAAVEAVRDILLEAMPWLSRDDVARAMSGIGVYSPLSQDAIEVIRRDQKAQLLLLEQMRDWNKGQAPPATGQERPPVSDEQRRLRKAVNEAKKAAGIVEASPGQLRSALDAAKRMARNRITDLTKALDTGKRIPSSRRVLQPDAELVALQETRDELQKLYDAAFGRKQLTDEQRRNQAEKALDRAIASLEADLGSGKLYSDPPKARVTSPAIEAKRAALEALKASREELRISSGEAQARSDAAYERILKERDARLAKRLADKDFAPREKKPEREYTPSMLKTMLSIENQKRQLNEEMKNWQFQNRHPVYKALTWGPIAASAFIRKALTTWDQSLIGRQGYLLGITHPGIYRKAIRSAFASNPLEAKSIFPTEQDLFNTQTALDADAAWVRLERKAKLAVTDVHGGLKREEGNQFIPEWMNRIWGVGGSERAGSAFINTQRRLVFRSLVDKLTRTMDGKNKTISDSDLQVIGNLVNVASGRASIGTWSAALKAASAVFFSPQWWASRLLWWSGQPVWNDSQWFGGEGASWEVRKLAAMEWGKQASAQAIIMGVVAGGLAAAFGAPGDDEEWDFYVDPRSPNFGRIRVGRTLFDMTAGLGQHLSFFARIITGTQADRWETQEVDKWRLATRYGRGKLAPVPAAIGDYLAGSSLGGTEFGTLSWIGEKVSPLSVQDVRKTAESEGVPLATVASTLMFFGLGAQSYDERIKARKDTANEVRAMQKQGKPQSEIDAVMNEHLKHAASLEAKESLRTAKPEEKAALQKIVDGNASPELADAIQKERGDITLMASELLSTEDKSRDKKSPDSDPSIITARALLKAIAPTYEDANRLYTEGYRRRNGSTTEVVRGQFVTKRNVLAARRRLRALYPQ